MTVKIFNHELDLHYSTRIYIIFENIMGSALQEIDPNSMAAQTALVYATLQSTLKYNKISETLTYDDVIDIIDENGGMAFTAKFNQWFTNCVNAETELIKKATEEPKEPKSKKK